MLLLLTKMYAELSSRRKKTFLGYALEGWGDKEDLQSCIQLACILKSLWEEMRIG